MRTIDAHVLTALARARAFIDRHATQLGAVDQAGYRTELDVVIAALQQNSVGQAAARRISAGELARQQASYGALRLNHMRQIVAIAAARRHEIPELDAVRMPSRKSSPGTLIAAAGAMAIVGRQYAPLFIASGLPADFVERLETAAESLGQTLTDRGTTASERSGATAALRAGASRGRHVLRVLGSMIEPLLASDPALLAEWKSARHILRPPTARAVPFVPLLSTAKLAAPTPGPAPAPAGERPNVALAPVAELALPPAADAPVETPQQSSGLGGVFTRVVRAFAGQATGEVNSA